MTTTARTDIHRPSAPEFDPEAYICMGVWDMAPEFPNPAAVEARMLIVNSLIDQGYTIGHGSSRDCGHCGAFIRYAALMVRHDVKQYIYVGETCLEGRFETLTAAEFKNLRETARLNRDRMAKTTKIATLIEANPVLVTVNDEDTLAKCGLFVNDIARKLRMNGELSERQIEAFGKAVTRDLERYEREQNREAERQAKVAAGVQCPAGKVTVAGTVVWSGWKDSDFGGAFKMIVESDEGWKVWATVPAKICGDDGIAAGTKVQFDATVTVKDDPTFGYASRPSKARIV